jgi:hypothetical protein
VLACNPQCEFLAYACNLINQVASTPKAARQKTHGKGNALIFLAMLSAVHETALWTAAKIEAARKLMDETAGFVRARCAAIYSRDLIELLFVQPCCRIGAVVDAGLWHRETASKHLKTLADRFYRLLTAESNAFDAFG